MEKSLEEKVKDIIDVLRPQLQFDGGDVLFVELTADNVVKVELKGACGSCPHSQMTLKKGIEALIRHDLPEIKSVEDINLKF